MTVPRSAVVLAGGRSRRMGTEKALLETGGVTLVERALANLARGFESLYVSVARSGASDGLRSAVGRFEEGANRRVGLVPDRLEGAGPITGIHAALETIEDDRAFFLAVDLPRIFFPLVELLWEKASEEGCSGCVPASGEHLQPVFAVYCRSLAERIPPVVAAGQSSLQRLCRSLPTVRIVNLDDPWWQDRVFPEGCARAERASIVGELFRNINTPADYREWVEKGA